MSFCETHKIEIPDQPDDQGRQWVCAWCINDRWKAGMPLYPKGEYVIYARDEGRLACIEPRHVAIDEKDMENNPFFQSWLREPFNKHGDTPADEVPSPYHVWLHEAWMAAVAFSRR